MLVPLFVLIAMPTVVLPEMTLRSAAVVPPTTLLLAFHNSMPAPLLAALVPEESRPSQLPAMVLPLLVPTEMATVAKFCMMKPRIVLPSEPPTKSRPS